MELTEIDNLILNFQSSY